MPDFPLVPLLLASLLSIHGLRKKSLSPSGSATAFVVGLLMMAGGTSTFGCGLIGLYLCGSTATKCASTFHVHRHLLTANILTDGKKKKAQLEEGYEEYGYRSGWQVLSNSFSGLVCCVLWNAVYAPRSLQAWLVPIAWKEPLTGCPVAGGWSRVFIMGALGHFGCCLGDTLASELGILASAQPRLVTTMKKVPPGTNGAVSVGGTLASLVGGVIMGGIMGLGVGCRIPELLAWGGLAGLGGSMIDSFLGATIQETRWSGRISKVGKRINGVNVLTNNQVNVVASLITALLFAYFSQEK